MRLKMDYVEGFLLLSPDRSEIEGPWIEGEAFKSWHIAGQSEWTAPSKGTAGN